MRVPGEAHHHGNDHSDLNSADDGSDEDVVHLLTAGHHIENVEVQQLVALGAAVRRITPDTNTATADLQHILYPTKVKCWAFILKHVDLHLTQVWHIEGAHECILIYVILEKHLPHTELPPPFFPEIRFPKSSGLAEQMLPAGGQAVSHLTLAVFTELGVVIRTRGGVIWKPIPL